MAEYILQLTPTEFFLMVLIFFLAVLGSYFLGRTTSFQQVMGEFMRNAQDRVDKNVQDMKSGIEDINRQVGDIGDETKEIRGSVSDVQNEMEAREDFE